MSLRSPQDVLLGLLCCGMRAEGRQRNFIPVMPLAGCSPCPAALVFEPFFSALLWARALPAAPGGGLRAEKSWAGQAATPTPKFMGSVIPKANFP